MVRAREGRLVEALLLKNSFLHPTLNFFRESIANISLSAMPFLHLLLFLSSEPKYDSGVNKLMEWIPSNFVDKLLKAGENKRMKNISS